MGRSASRNPSISRILIAKGTETNPFRVLATYINHLSVVVDAKISQANKTTLRSERSGALKKRKKVREKLEKNKKGLDRADIVRDYRLCSSTGFVQVATTPTIAVNF